MNVLSIESNGDIQTDYDLAGVKTGPMEVVHPDGRVTLTGPRGWAPWCQHATHGTRGWLGDTFYQESGHLMASYSAETELLQHIAAEHPEWLQNDRTFDEVLVDGPMQMPSRRSLFAGHRFTAGDHFVGFLQELGDAFLAIGRAFRGLD